jgi:prophage regulatory protein
MAYRLLDLDGVRDARGGAGKSTVYRDIREGRLPPPLKLGRSSLWPEYEIELINGAIIGGASDEQIKVLVKELLAARSSLWPRYEISGDQIRARVEELQAARGPPANGKSREASQ